MFTPPEAAVCARPRAEQLLPSLASLAIDAARDERALFHHVASSIGGFADDANDMIFVKQPHRKATSKLGSLIWGTAWRETDEEHRSKLTKLILETYTTHYEGEDYRFENDENAWVVTDMISVLQKDGSPETTLQYINKITEESTEGDVTNPSKRQRSSELATSHNAYNWIGELQDGNPVGGGVCIYRDTKDVWRGEVDEQMRPTKHGTLIRGQDGMVLTGLFDKGEIVLNTLATRVMPGQKPEVGMFHPLERPDSSETKVWMNSLQLAQFDLERQCHRAEHIIPPHLRYTDRMLVQKMGMDAVYAEEEQIVLRRSSSGVDAAIANFFRASNPAELGLGSDARQYMPEGTGYTELVPIATFDVDYARCSIERNWQNAQGRFEKKNLSWRVFGRTNG